MVRTMQTQPTHCKHKTWERGERPFAGRRGMDAIRTAQSRIINEQKPEYSIDV